MTQSSSTNFCRYTALVHLDQSHPFVTALYSIVGVTPLNGVPNAACVNSPLLFIQMISKQQATPVGLEDLVDAFRFRKTNIKDTVWDCLVHF